jgi:hypothetical protein
MSNRALSITGAGEGACGEWDIPSVSKIPETACLRFQIYASKHYVFKHYV